MAEILKVERLSYSYSDSAFKALDGLSFSVEPGMTVGIIGPNGSGKTTLMKSLLSVLDYEGSVKISGTEVKSFPRRRLARIIGVVAQEFNPAYDMTALEIVRMGRTPHTGFLGEMKREDLESVDRAFDELGISHLKERMFYSMSGGERQMVYAAKVMAQDPRILLLDESTAHLDLGNSQQLLAKVKRFSEREGKTVLATFHDINQASVFSDMLIVMKSGKIIDYGKPENVLSERMIREVYGASCSIVRDSSGKVQILIGLEDGRGFVRHQDIVNL